MKPPTAFIPTTSPSLRPEPQRARVVDTVPEFIPPDPPMPTATLRPSDKRGKSRSYLLTPHQSLVKALGLRYGRPIALHPPVYGSPYWHLDLRPEASCMVKCYDDQRPRVEGIRLPPGLVEEPITLHLVPGPPKYPDVYPMIASNALLAQTK